MAQGFSCDNDDGFQAVILVTNLTNGDTAAFCPTCWPNVARAMADAIDGGIASADLMDDTVIDPLAASVATNGDEPAPSAPKSRARHVATTERAEEESVTSAATSNDE